MQDRLALALDQMVYAAELVVTYVEGLDRDSFYADQKTQQAVILNLLIIGETAARIMTLLEADHHLFDELPLRNMKGLRNRIAHGYFDMNLAVVWDTVDTAIPDLILRLRKIISIRQK
jgi:uncharacterized protein with HEPN domain